MKQELVTRRLFSVVAMLVFGTCTSTWSQAQDWSQFRGKDSTGVAETGSWPDRWNDSENIVWKLPVAGRGWSSPIVTGDRVFLTTVTRQNGSSEEAKPGLYFGGDRPKAEDAVHEWNLLCVRKTDGAEIWRRTLHTGRPQTSRHIKNSYASESPVTDGERVYVLFGDVGLYCITIDGDPVWSKPLPPCKTRLDWGTAASPVLHGEKLFVVSDNEDASYLAGYNKRSGDQLWRVERDEKSNWATPYIWQNPLRTEIITPGTGKTRAYDLDGRPLYEFGGLSSITIAMPYAAHGLLFVSSGYVNDEKRPIFAIRPGASGDISLKDDQTSSTFMAWCQKQAAPYNPSTIVYGDQLYVVSDRGLFASYDARTGELIYDKKRLPNGRAFTASPWAANGKLYCLNEYGETFVIKAGRDFEVLHTNSLTSDQVCMATPALTSDRIFLRTGDALYCIGNSDNR